MPSVKKSSQKKIIRQPGDPPAPRLQRTRSFASPGRAGFAFFLIKYFSCAPILSHRYETITNPGFDNYTRHFSKISHKAALSVRRVPRRRRRPNRSVRRKDPPLPTEARAETHLSSLTLTSTHFLMCPLTGKKQPLRVQMGGRPRTNIFPPLLTQSLLQ